MPKCILSYERSCFVVERRSNVFLCRADRGGAAGGGVLWFRVESLELRVELHITVRFSVSQLSSLNPQLNKTALRLWFNPFGSDEPLPLSRHWHGDTGGDIRR